MRNRKTILILILIAFAAFALWAQTTRQPTSPGSTPSASAPVNAAPQSTLIRILTPVANQQLGTNFTSVSFELTASTASGTPNFLIQMDGNDPIRTSTTEYDFTGLAPGPHNVTVTVVDANDTPLAGGRAVVAFLVPQSSGQPATIEPKKAAPAAQPGQQQQPQPRKASPGGMAYIQPQMMSAGYAPPPSLTDDDSKLPSASSALPLLSVIGFGVLLGGIASAMKTR